MLPSVCVIIPTYNQAAFIRRAVDSALAQRYANLQVVVADDASTDGTRAVLEAEIAGRRIDFHSNEINRGRVGNYRHALLNYTAADWVVNLDGDDFFINEHFIAEAVRAIQERGEDKVLFFQGAHETRGDQPEAGDSGAAAAAEVQVVLTASDYFFGFFERKKFSHLTTLYRRDIALRSGFYECDTLSSDLYSVLKLCLNHPDHAVILSNKTSAVWYQHAANSSKSVAPAVHLKNFRTLEGLAQLARERGQGRIKCLIWECRLVLFYLLLYAGSLWRNGIRGGARALA